MKIDFQKVLNKLATILFWIAIGVAAGYWWCYAQWKAWAVFHNVPFIM